MGPREFYMQRSSYLNLQYFLVEQLLRQVENYDILCLVKFILRFETDIKTIKLKLLVSIVFLGKTASLT